MSGMHPTNWGIFALRFRPFRFWKNEDWNVPLRFCVSAFIFCLFLFYYCYCYYYYYCYCYDFKFITVINATWAVMKESLKKSRLRRESNPWPQRHRCTAPPVEPSSPLGASHLWVRNEPVEDWHIWLTVCERLCSHCGWLLLKCSAIGIGFNGAETNCGIAHILGILLMNSCNTDIFCLATTIICSLSALKHIFELWLEAC